MSDEPRRLTTQNVGPHVTALGTAITAICAVLALLVSIGALNYSMQANRIAAESNQIAVESNHIAQLASSPALTVTLPGATSSILDFEHLPVAHSQIPVCPYKMRLTNRGSVSDSIISWGIKIVGLGHDSEFDEDTTGMIQLPAWFLAGTDIPGLSHLVAVARPINSKYQPVTMADLEDKYANAPDNILELPHRIEGHSALDVEIRFALYPTELSEVDYRPSSELTGRSDYDIRLQYWFETASNQRLYSEQFECMTVAITTIAKDK
jgi:hypothetical protein